MFSGIIEEVGRIKSLTQDGGNLHLEIAADISKDLKIDQSVAHNGVCLTVVAQNEHSHIVTAIAETLDKTNLGSLKVGDAVNLERCLTLNSRLDGHMVQGHVDTTAKVISIVETDGSWEYVFEYEPNMQFITVSKGSICVNGVSLTVVLSELNRFSVAIIPYTYEHTNFNQFKLGDLVNLEFDIIGKYILRYAELFKTTA